jgi:hypothetical protein
MKLFIAHTKNIQFNHVQAIKEQLPGNTTHPSDGKTTTHISLVMNQITKKILTNSVKTNSDFRLLTKGIIALKVEH